MWSCQLHVVSDSGNQCGDGKQYDGQSGLKNSDYVKNSDQCNGSQCKSKEPNIVQSSNKGLQSQGCQNVTERPGSVKSAVTNDNWSKDRQIASNRKPNWSHLDGDSEVIISYFNVEKSSHSCRRNLNDKTQCLKDCSDDVHRKECLSASQQCVARQDDCPHHSSGTYTRFTGSHTPGKGEMILSGSKSLRARDQCLYDPVDDAHNQQCLNDSSQQADMKQGHHDSIDKFTRCPSSNAHRKAEMRLTYTYHKPVWSHVKGQLISAKHIGYRKPCKHSRVHIGSISSENCGESPCGYRSDQYRCLEYRSCIGKCKDQGHSCGTVTNLDCCKSHDGVSSKTTEHAKTTKERPDSNKMGHDSFNRDIIKYSEMANKRASLKITGYDGVIEEVLSDDLAGYCCAVGSRSNRLINIKKRNKGLGTVPVSCVESSVHEVRLLSPCCVQECRNSSPEETQSLSSTDHIPDALSGLIEQLQCE